MRLAVYQGPADAMDVAAALDLLERTATETAARGGTMLVCPEMYLTGYAIGAEAARRLAEPVDGPSATRAAAIARRTGVALLYGYPELGRDGQVYNAAVLIDRQGRTLLNYRKTHLFGDLDRGMFAAGDALPEPAEVDGLRIGVLICYDLEFPENARAWALAGCDLLAVPTANMEPYEFVGGPMVRTRAFENQMAVAYANRCGAEGELRYFGQSSIAAPDGEVLAVAGRDAALIMADLDPADLARRRRINTYLRDRRPALYGDLTRGR